MSQARDLADLGSSAEAGTVTGDSLVINGDMAVAQRGTSSTGLGASEGYYTVDRFQLGVGGTATAGRLTMSQDSDAPIGFGSCIKLACTTADTSIAADENLRLITVLEGQNLQAFKKGTANAESMTLSFYVKGNSSATYVIELYDTDNARHICSTFSVTTSWQRVEITFDGDTTGEFGNDNGGSLRLHFWLHAGSNYNSGTLATSWAANTNANRAVGADSFYDSTSRTFQITGLKLEVGSTATPFKHESYADNLAKCQRYFQRFTHSTSSNGLANGTSYTNLAHYFVFHHPVRMRTRASIGYSALSDFRVYTQGASETPTTIAFQGGTDGTTEFYCNTSAIGSGGNGIWIRLYTSNSKFDFNAEL